MFFDREYSAEEVHRHVGSHRQVADIRSFTLNDGREKGVHCMEFRTGSGLNFTVVPDRGMDIAACDYKGINLVWQSATGIAGPAFYEPSGAGWIRGFFGGLLTTCGLYNVGVPNDYRGEHFGMHGRLSYLPANQVSYDACWAGDDYFLLAKGEMREARPFLYNLVLRRRIQARAGEKSFVIHDTVTNEGHESTPCQVLYHINAGFPLVAGGSRLLAASRTVTPRDADAADEKENHAAFTAPIRGFREKVYYHDPAPCSDGRAWVAVVNPDLGSGLGLFVKYRTETLPRLVQWKMLGEGMYVVGIEPSNSHGVGIEREEKMGTLQMIEPGQDIDFHLELGVLDGLREITDFEREIRIAAPGAPEYQPALL